MSTKKNTPSPPVTTMLNPMSQVAIMLISASSFTAAFAWNGAITSFLDQKFGAKGKSFKVFLIYALTVTILAGVLIYFIVKYTNVWITKQQEIEDITT